MMFKKLGETAVTKSRPVRPFTSVFLWDIIVTNVIGWTVHLITYYLVFGTSEGIA